MFSQLRPGNAVQHIRLVSLFVFFPFISFLLQLGWSAGLHLLFSCPRVHCGWHRMAKAPCCLRCRNVGAGIRIGVRCSFFFFSPLNLSLLFFLLFFSSTSCWYAVSSVPVATRKRGYLDISYPGYINSHWYADFTFFCCLRRSIRLSWYT